VAQLEEDVLEELERDALGLRDPLALDGPFARRSCKLEHGAKRVVGLGGDTHRRIVAAHDYDRRVASTFLIGGELEIDRLGFGAMRLCGHRILGWPRDRENALAVLRRAVELGVQLVDTSNAYGPEINELQIAEALHPYPKGLVIATKGGLRRTSSGGWPEDGRPQELREACEGSLKRLRLERIDLYQLHAPDPDVPIEDSVGELGRLRDEGKIRHVGLSNVSTEELERARRVVPVVSVQNRYSLSDRSSEGVLDVCEREGLAFLPWFPLASGNLARRGKALDKVAQTAGASRAQVALAWLLRHSPVMVPIPGTSSLEHLEENVAARHLELSQEDMAALGNDAGGSSPHS
jgi:pyridoxine 4-dehydrogenase